MQRIFTENVGGTDKAPRFAKGAVEDYPMVTWDSIARSAKKPLDKFSRPVEQAAKGGINGKSN